MRVGRARAWLLQALPAGLIARPMEWFIAVLCLIGGITIVAGIATPQSVAALLPRPIYLAWGGALILGGLGLTCGLTSYRRAAGGWVVARVPCYRLGLRMLGLASGLYTLAILVVGGWNGVPAVVFTSSFALTCGVRLLTLERSK
jgi:hypothetical protein